MEKRMNNVHTLLKIKSLLNSLKPAEQKSAEYILSNPDEVIHLSITRLAEKVGVSEATVVKFCQHIGYSGYQELKISLASSLEDTEDKEYIYEDINPDDSLDVIIDKIFQIYNKSFAETKKILKDSSLVESVSMLMKARRIFFYGYGASGIVAMDGELKFKRIGYNAEALLDNHSQKTVSCLLTENDLVVAISNSGCTKELIESLIIAGNAGAKIIAITSHLGSPVSKHADQTLLYSSEETQLRGSALASRLAQMAVLDMLFLGVATAQYDKIAEALTKTRNTVKTSKMEG
jgi:DNA-binding MurR/RpiR family transcriptional regulator